MRNLWRRDKLWEESVKVCQALGGIFGGVSTSGRNLLGCVKILEVSEEACKALGVKMRHAMGEKCKHYSNSWMNIM